MISQARAMVAQFGSSPDAGRRQGRDIGMLTVASPCTRVRSSALAPPNNAPSLGSTPIEGLEPTPNHAGAVPPTRH